MMDHETITSEQLERLLLRLGFSRSPSEGPQRVFENPEFDAVLLLPKAGSEPLARIEHLLTLRKVAEERGIVDANTFDTLLDEVDKESSDSFAKAS